MISQELINTVVGMAVSYAPKVLLALVTLFVGLRVITLLTRGMEFAMKKRRVDASLRHFLESLIAIGLKILLFISVISMLGVATTSFVAILGAAGLAIGLALQGSLANFAGGALILLFKPFKVGDFIEAQGHMGTVKKIEVFNTIMTTPDNKTIIIPNGAVSNGSIVNFSKEKLRRVDLTFGIGYDDDIKKAQKVLLDIVKKQKRVLKDPAPFVRVGELADSSVNFTVRLWVEAKDYWDVHFDMIETVKLRFDKEKISIPYPQMDVHMKKK